MPTLNIDVNARTERAKKDLRSLDKEILKLSDSEKILSKSLTKSGDVGATAFRKISSAAVRQAKAVNSAAGQFRQLRSQLQAAGAAPQVIGRLTQEFVTFRRVMEGGTVASLKFQRTQDKFSNTLRTTARQFKILSGEVKDTTNATAKLNAKNKANQAALARQAHALSNAKIQYKQLIAQMRRLGASRDTIRSTTRAFVTFSKGMKTTALSSIQLQRAQDRLKTSFAGTRRQLVRAATATNKANAAAMKGGKSFTGLGHTLENLGSTAVLVAGPLSGIGSRLIAFGAIAKRGSLASAGLFAGFAAGATIMFKAIRAFDALNLSLAKTEAILKATGKEAQITSKFVERVAARVARKTLANLEDTRPVAAGLLSFRGINADNLEDILTLAQDISSTGFTDFTNAAKLLGRVLEDPIANLDALRRVFVQLTPLQKDQITNLQNMGRGAEAAGIIIDVLRKKFGGVGEAQNTGLSGAMDRLGQAWTQLLETMGTGAIFNLVVESVNKLADSLEAFRKGIAKTKEDFKNFFNTIKNFGRTPSVTIDIPPKPKPKPLEITIPRPPDPPSRFEKALIDVNVGIKRSIMDLDAEANKLRQGFSLLSPEILKLAEKHKVLDDIVKVLEGDFSGLTDKGREIANMAIDTSDALLKLEKRQEGAAISKETRTALVKYNDELRRLMVLYDGNYISAGALTVKQRELRATLESTTPELNILTSASEKFGDSLADLIVKGESFASGLKSIFKSLVDDIIKQFIKMSVINPILNGIFGESAGRPQMGSQGGGMFGLGGAGGLLGKATGSAANDNASQESMNRVVEDFEEEGLKQATNYGKSLAKTNVKMGAVGAQAAGDFSNIFSNIAGGVVSAIGGGIGSFLGNSFANLLGFQHGGSFKVGGSGGKDSQLVAFKASPRERVSVETPGQQNRRGGGNVTYIDARGVDPGQMNRLIQVVKDLDESVEIRAVNATADTRDRNPSLFGRAL